VADPRPPGATLWSFFRPYLRAVLVGTLGLAVTSAMVVAIPWTLRVGIDALQDGDRTTAVHAAWTLGGLVVLQAAFRVFSRVRVFNVGRLVEYDLRTALLDRIHQLGPGFFGRMPTGEVMSRAINDLNQVRLACGFGVMNVAHTAFMYVGGLGLMIAIDWRLTLATTVTFPLLWIIVRRFGRQIFARSRAAQDVLGSLSDRVQQSLAGVRVVRSFGTEAREVADFEVLNREAVAKNMSLVGLRAWMFPVLGLASALGTLVVLWYGGTRVVAGEITLGEFVAFQGYLALLTWPTIALGFVLSVFQRGRASFERISEILDAAPDIPPDPPGLAPPGARARGEIEVAHLSVRYGDTVALEDVSFSVPAGSRLAIVGRTAAGKSTLATLLARLLPAPAGTIRLDGTDVNDLSLAATRRAVGYSPQEAFLFSTSVERNVAFGLDAPDGPAASGLLREAASAAQVLEEIEGMTDGWGTVVGERGVQLSGGQKQRIALARAIAADPAILVLDDPLSAVDAQTEKKILDALDAASRGRTLVLVTNRTSAAARCDQVLVLEGGRITERGTHEALVRSGGLYAAFDQKQRLERELESL